LTGYCFVAEVKSITDQNGDFQQNHIRTAPLAKYDRYWDVMSTSSA
jgi:hypothetical protein